MQRAMAVCAVVLGCGGSSGHMDAPGTGSACTFAATLDGVSWVASQSSASNSGQVLGVIGSDAGEGLAVGLADPATGTFDTATSGLVAFRVTFAGSDATWTASMSHGSGTLTVSELTASHVTGSFAGTLLIDGTGSGSAIALAGGAFDCNL
jgi:hypothetical protein